MPSVLPRLLLGLIISSAVNVGAQTAPPRTNVHPRRHGVRRVPVAPAGGQATDHDLTENIRRALAQDGVLARVTRSVKITAEGGHVILEGTVRSEEERQLIESRAIEIAGAMHVSNELTIAKPR